MDVTIITDEDDILRRPRHTIIWEEKSKIMRAYKKPFELKTMFDINILTKHRAVVNPKQKRLRQLIC